MSSNHSSYAMMSMENATTLVHTMAHQRANAIADDETIQVCDSRQRILATDVIALHPFPPFAASIMDGYAVVSSDGVGDYPCVATYTAGPTSTNTIIESGSLAYITTGAPLPAGADAVIKIEWTEKLSNGLIRVKNGVSPGQWIRAIGSDISSEDKVLSANTVIGPIEIGLLSMLGHNTVCVRNKPTVAIVSTGNELLSPTSKHDQHGTIYDSNRPMLKAALDELNVNVIDCGIVPDDSTTMNEIFNSVLREADILITTGGVSMGTHDFVKPWLESCGATIHFGRLCMKPGKPTMFATIADSTQMVFALPGNPVSAMVTFKLLVIPAIRILQGISPSHTIVQATLANALTPDPYRPEYHRVIASWDNHRHTFLARSTGKQCSSKLNSLLDANALICVPKGNAIIAADTSMPCILFNIATPDVCEDNEQRIDNDTSSSRDMRSHHHHHHHHHDPHTHHQHPHKHHHHPHTHHHHHHHHREDMNMESRSTITVALLVCSDRAHNKVYDDISGCAARDFLHQIKTHDFSVIELIILPDDAEVISHAIASRADDSQSAPHVILTIGGTGFSARDVTPEATASVLERRADNLVTAMMMKHVSHVPMAMLSRAIAGTRASSVIVNLVGNPKGVVENLEVIAPDALAHAVRLLRGK